MTPPSDPFDTGSPFDSPGRPAASTFGGPQNNSAGMRGYGPNGGSAPLVVSKPPVILLGIAAVVAVVGIAVGVLAGTSGPLGVVAWVVAGPVAIGVLSAFTLVDTKRRAFPVYTNQSWVAAAYWGVLLLAAIGIIIGALRIADWVGRL